jgi:genome maintenance exonuclease 1
VFNHETIDLGYEDLMSVTKSTGRTYTTPPSPHGRKTFPSITTVLGLKSKKGIDAWRKRVGEVEANKILHRASNRGTAVHEITEKYLNNEENYQQGYMPNVVENFLDIKPIFERIGTIYGQELPLYSEHLSVAGRVDCIADFDGVLSIIDFKTSLRPKKREWVETYFMQECFYSIALFERTGMRAHQLVTIIAVDNNPPQLFIEDMDNWVEPLKEAINEFVVQTTK